MFSIKNILIAVVVIYVIHRIRLAERAHKKVNEALDPAMASLREAEKHHAEKEILNSVEPAEVIEEALEYVQDRALNEKWWTGVQREADNNGVEPWQIIWSKAISYANQKFENSIH